MTCVRTVYVYTIDLRARCREPETDRAAVLRSMDLPILLHSYPTHRMHACIYVATQTNSTSLVCPMHMHASTWGTDLLRLRGHMHACLHAHRPCSALHAIDRSPYICCHSICTRALAILVDRAAIILYVLRATVHRTSFHPSDPWPLLADVIETKRRADRRNPSCPRPCARASLDPSLALLPLLSHRIAGRRRACLPACTLRRFSPYVRPPACLSAGFHAASQHQHAAAGGRKATSRSSFFSSCRPVPPLRARRPPATAGRRPRRDNTREPPTPPCTCTGTMGTAVCTHERLPTDWWLDWMLQACMHGSDRSDGSSIRRDAARGSQGGSRTPERSAHAPKPCMQLRRARRACCAAPTYVYSYGASTCRL